MPKHGKKGVLTAYAKALGAKGGKARARARALTKPQIREIGRQGGLASQRLHPRRKKS